MSCSIFETVGGAELTDFEPMRLRWDETANDADSVDVTIDLEGPEGDRDWGAYATPIKHSVAVDYGGKLIGGPILPDSIEGDGRQLRFTARGLRHLGRKVPVLRREVLNRVQAGQNPLLGADGKPDTSLDLTFANLDLGSIGAAALAEVLAWPGWSDVPVVIPQLRAGTRTTTYPAVDRKTLDAAWSDLSNRKSGPDIRLRLQRGTDGKFFWLYESGTETQPRLQGDTVFDWDITEQSGFRRTTDPSRMGSIAWSEGGRTADTTMIAATYDPTLIANGYPLLHLDSDASTSTTQESTGQEHNLETLRTAGQPAQFWSFRVPIDASPTPGEYAGGDLVRLHVSDPSPVRGNLLPSVPGGYLRRIAQLSGDEEGRWVTITCGPAYGAEVPGG